VRPGGGHNPISLGLVGGEQDEAEESQSDAEPTDVSKDCTDKRGLVSSSLNSATAFPTRPLGWKAMLNSASRACDVAFAISRLSSERCSLFLATRASFGHTWQCKQLSPWVHPDGFQNHMQGLHRPVPCSTEPWLGIPAGGGKPGAGRTPFDSRSRSASATNIVSPTTLLTSVCPLYAPGAEAMRMASPSINLPRYKPCRCSCEVAMSSILTGSIVEKRAKLDRLPA